MSLYVKSFSAYLQQFSSSPKDDFGEWGVRIITLLKSPYGCALAIFALAASAYAIYRYRNNPEDKSPFKFADSERASPSNLTSQVTAHRDEPLSRKQPCKLLPVDQNDLIALGKLKIERTNSNHPVWSLEQAQRLGVEPTHLIIIEQTTYYISNPFLFGQTIDKSHPGFSVLVAQNGACYPRTFYLSRSQAIYRYIPAIVKYQNRNGEKQTGHIGKGHEEIDTNLPIDLTVALSQFMTRFKMEELKLWGAEGPMDNINSEGGLWAIATDSYLGNIQANNLNLEKTADIVEQIRQPPEKNLSAIGPKMEDLKDFAPNFTTCEEFDFESSLYGMMKARIYTSKNGQLQYLFYELVKAKTDQHASMEGKAFLASVEQIEENPILKYGNRNRYLTDFLDATKPLFEYYEMVKYTLWSNILRSNAPRGGAQQEYVCFWNCIRNVNLIQEYYKAQNRELPQAYPVNAVI